MKLIAGLLAAHIAFSPVAAASLSEEDRTTLEQLKHANDDAWNRRDAAAITRQYAADATVRVAPSVELVTGVASIDRFFTASFARREGEFRHVTTLAHLEPLDDRTVLSEGDVRVERLESNGTWSLVRRFRTISIVIREDKVWKLRSVRAVPLS